MSILTDDSNTGPSDDAAVASLMSSLVPSKGAAPSDTDEDEDDEEDLDESNGHEDADEDADDDEDPDNDEDNDDDGEGDDDDEEADKANASTELTDDAVVKVTVDGEEHEVTIGSLKRLAGQEASLTKKSQEADLVGQRAATILRSAIDTVLEDLQAYDQVDWVLEGSRMDPEEFEWHREQYGKLQERKDKLIQGAKVLGPQLEQRQAEKLQEEAENAVKVLSDPKTGIEGWNDELYENILSFAVEAGLPRDEVASITNPHVIKIINDARKWRQAQKAAPQKVNLTPKRVRKGGGDEGLRAKPERAQKALEKKLQAGTATDDDAMAALMGRWGVSKQR